MSRSFIYLRRALCGTSCAIVFGFGATQAFAEPQTGPARQIRCEIYETRCPCNGSYYCVPWGAECLNPACLD